MTQIKPLQVKNRLANTPNLKPHFSVQSKFTNFLNHGASKIDCSEPKALRSLVALMDMNAVFFNRHFIEFFDHIFCAGNKGLRFN